MENIHVIFLTFLPIEIAIISVMCDGQTPFYFFSILGCILTHRFLRNLYLSFQSPQLSWGVGKFPLLLVLFLLKCGVFVDISVIWINVKGKLRQVSKPSP